MSPRRRKPQPDEDALRARYEENKGRFPLPSVGTHVHFLGTRYEIIGLDEDNEVVLLPGRGRRWCIQMELFQEQLKEYKFRWGRETITIGDAALVSRLLDEVKPFDYKLDVGRPVKLPPAPEFRHEGSEHYPYHRPVPTCPLGCAELARRFLGLELPVALAFAHADGSNKNRYVFTAMCPVDDEPLHYEINQYPSRITLGFAGYHMNAQGQLTYPVSFEHAWPGQIVLRRTLKNQWVPVSFLPVKEAA